MSLTVNLMVAKPVSIYDNNITHNLSKMASEVKLSNGLSLYDVLWRPDEHELELADDHEKAITALRDRLAQPEQEPFEYWEQ